MAAGEGIGNVTVRGVGGIPVFSGGFTFLGEVAEPAEWGGQGVSIVEE